MKEIFAAIKKIKDRFNLFENNADERLIASSIRKKLSSYNLAGTDFIIMRG